VIIEPAKTFTRTFRGYDPAAVDAYIEASTIKQQLLANDVESLRAGLKDRDDEVAALRREVATLTETSSSPHAVQQRMTTMLRRALDEIAEMQAEARAEAHRLITTAKAEAEVEQQAHEEVLAELVARRNALEAEHEQTKTELDAELAKMRAETQTDIDASLQDAREKHDQLLADAKLEADYYRDQACRALDEANAQRVKVLEQLMGVYRDLEAVPAALESAYEDAKTSRESSVAAPRSGELVARD